MKLKLISFLRLVIFNNYNLAKEIKDKPKIDGKSGYGSCRE